MIRALLVLILLVAPALAHNDGRWNDVDPKIRQWLKDQRVPNGPFKGTSCCSEADGEEVQEDIRDGHYWIKGGHFPDWTPVPDEAVIHGPNEWKQPITWWTLSGSWAQVPVVIRCYAPGAGI